MCTGVVYKYGMGKRIRPTVKQYGNTWHLIFGRAPNRVHVSLGIVSDVVADLRAAEISAAMAGGEWPDWALQREAIRKYISATRDAVDADLESYDKHLAATVTDQTRRQYIDYLTQLKDFAGGLDGMTTAMAQKWLDAAAKTWKPRTVGAMRQAARRYYYWAHGRRAPNPFGQGAVRVKPETPPESIQTLDRTQLARALGAADRIENGIAVWVAAYSGLRRGEIARLDLANIGKTIRVLPGKTNVGRDVPLHPLLRKKLVSVHGKKKTGLVVPGWQDYKRWQDGASSTLYLLRKADPDLPKCARAWNTYRHTFATLLVRGDPARGIAGKSLSYVAAVLGNSESVCRRHYARFVTDDSADDLAALG